MPCPFKSTSSSDQAGPSEHRRASDSQSNYDPESGFSDGAFELIDLGSALFLASYELTRLRDKLLQYDHADPFYNETELRKLYHEVFNCLLPERKHRAPDIKMDEEVDWRGEDPGAWDAMEEVRLLREMFNNDRSAIASAAVASIVATASALSSRSHSTASSATTSTSSATSAHKSRKYGPHKPDLAARRLGDKKALGQGNQYGGIGEIKLNKYRPDQQAQADAQLLEGLCQSLWYMACGGRLFGLRLGMLIINDCFKRLFLLDETTIAVEVPVDSQPTDAFNPPPIPNLGTSDHSRACDVVLPDAQAPDANQPTDVEVLAAGMNDPRCARLCALPNRLLLPNEVPAENQQAQRGNITVPSGYQLAALSRLMTFWATALICASKTALYRSRHAGLQPPPAMSIFPSPSTTTFYSPSPSTERDPAPTYRRDNDDGDDGDDHYQRQLSVHSEHHSGGASNDTQGRGSRRGGDGGAGNSRGHNQRGNGPHDESDAGCMRHETDALRQQRRVNNQNGHRIGFKVATASARHNNKNNVLNRLVRVQNWLDSIEQAAKDSDASCQRTMVDYADELDSEHHCHLPRLPYREADVDDNQALHVGDDLGSSDCAAMDHETYNSLNNTYHRVNSLIAAMSRRGLKLCAVNSHQMDLLVNGSDMSTAASERPQVNVPNSTVRVTQSGLDVDVSQSDATRNLVEQDGYPSGTKKADEPLSSCCPSP